MKKIKELRDLSINELKAALVEQRKELYNLSQKNSLSKERQIHKVGAARKGIARTLTILKEAELANKS